MEKLVRVIKLQPGEAVVILAEDEPAPCPCCCACMMQNDTCEDDPVKSIRYLLITSVKLNVSARRILDTVMPVPGIPA